MNAHDLTFVGGMDDTRSALRRWSAGRWRVLADWTGKSLLITVGLLIAV
jgi:hypothetical protein